MDVSYLLDSLNDKQREAVAAPRSNLLVLAGAGSGKTRVLVHRIAWLMSVENCSPYSIMAVTFTNKAAAEMRHRIGQLRGTSQGGMWVGTFHGLAHRLLRAHHMDANLPQDFRFLHGPDAQSTENPQHPSANQQTGIRPLIFEQGSPTKIRNLLQSTVFQLRPFPFGPAHVQNHKCKQEGKKAGSQWGGF